MMSPLDIMLLLHYSYSSAPWPQLEAIAVTESLERWVRQDCLLPDGSGYKATEKGNFMVEMLCATPLPVQKWVDPRQQCEALVGRDMNWNQPICESCWKQRHPDRRPFSVIDADRETCCFCGSMTMRGIYVRIDPRTVPHPTADKE